MSAAARPMIAVLRRAALPALLVAACGGGAKGGEGGGSGGGSGRGGGGGGGRQPPAVQVVTVTPRRIAETRTVTGTLTAAREARLVAQLEGAVTRVLVEEGDAVRQGQVLVTFDATVQQAELQAARTRTRTARAAADRASRLLGLGAASRAEQEEAAAALREAQGALQGALARAAYAEVRAPFAGVVTALRVNAGDVVGVRDEIAVVADPGELRVEVPVSELDLVRLRDGAPVAVVVDALGERPLAGRVRRVYPTVDPVSRQGVVEVALPRTAADLRPGLLARLTFTVAAVDSALAAPLDAVRRDVRDRSYVYTVGELAVRDSSAEGGTRRVPAIFRRQVRVGLRGGDNWVQVSSGLRAGDRVVVSGDQELSDSARVRVVPERRAPGADAPRTQAVAEGRGGGTTTAVQGGEVEAAGAPAGAGDGAPGGGGSGNGSGGGRGAIGGATTGRAGGASGRGAGVAAGASSQAGAVAGATTGGRAGAATGGRAGGAGRASGGAGRASGGAGRAGTSGGSGAAAGAGSGGAGGGSGGGGPDA